MGLDPFSSAFDLIKTGLDKIFPDADTELKGKLDAAAAEISNTFQLQLQQIEVNKVEAASGNAFTSSWRPCVGWICACSLAYSAILEPILRFAAMVIFDYKGNFPVINEDITMQILFGMLGIGAMRSFDKYHGNAKK